MRCGMHAAEYFEELLHLYGDAVAGLQTDTLSGFGRSWGHSPFTLPDRNRPSQRKAN